MPGVATVVGQPDGHPHDLLSRPNLSDEGYVTNIAGHVVSGWRRSDVRPWQRDSPPDALVGLLRHAARAGPQVVVETPHRELVTDRSVRIVDEFVAWKRDGVLTGHTRRSLPDADPAAETPELAAGLGFGTAAAHELPGAHLVHDIAKSMVVDMVNHRGQSAPHRRWPSAPGSGGRPPTSAFVENPEREPVLG